MTFCDKLMAVTGYPAHTFLIFMPAAGRLPECEGSHKQLLELMHSEGRGSERGLVDTVVDFLHKLGLKEEDGSN